MPSPLTSFRRPLAQFQALPRLHLLFYALILAGCALRIFNVVAHNPMDHLWSDPQRHWDHAREPVTPSPMALFDPLIYQTFVSILQRLTMGIPGLVAFYVSLLSILSPWCWYRFLREALASRTLALAGWALLALLPSWIGIFSYFMTETLFLPLLGASLWFTLRAKRKNDFPSFLALVAMWLLCGLTRPVGIPLAAVFTAFVWFGHAQKIRTAAWSAGFLALVLGPLSIRNYYFYGIWAPHGNGWINKIYAASGARVIELHFTKAGARWEYGFGSPSIDSRPFEPFSNWTSKRTGTVHVNVDFARGVQDWKKTYEASALHGAARWSLRWENIIYLFFGNSWPDNNPDYVMGRLSNVSRWIWAPLALALLVLTLCWWRTALRRPLIPVAIVIWLFVQGWMLVVPNEGRYRKPLEGLFVVYTLVLLDAKLRPGSESKASPASAQPTPST